MNPWVADQRAVLERPQLRVTQAGPQRLDLLERRHCEVEGLLAALPEGTDEASARLWLADAEQMLPETGEFDRARVLQACAVVRDYLARVGEPSGRQAFRDDAEAADLYERLGETAYAATGYTAAAIAALRAQEVSEALELAVRGLVAFESLPQSGSEGGRSAEARMAASLALLCCQFFDHERALRFAEIALRQTPPGQRQRWTVTAQLLAQVALARARELGEADPARRHLLARAEQLGHRLSTTAAGALARMVAGPRLVAEVLCERGQCEQAWVRLNQAASALPQGQGAGPAVRQERAALQLARGRCLLLLERPDQALPELDGALTALHPDRDLAEHIQALELRSLARERAGDTQGALADVRTLAEQIWVRHRRQIGGFMDQVWGRAGAEGRRRTLEAREQVLIRTAEQDPLTALVNRRGVERFWAGLGPGESMCLVMVDIDHFKDVNDRFGHAVGDAVLREVAAILSSSLRTVDQVARWGGEEFLIALPAGSAELGAEAAARVRRRVAEHDWSRLAAGLALTVSAGVASGSAHDLAGVLHRADAALYEAKRAGRNRVVTS